MNDSEWKIFFEICASSLGLSGSNTYISQNWCSWTTFERLNTDCLYWASGLPRVQDIGDNHILDGGVWVQPFSFGSLAHVVIPKMFYWETRNESNFESGFKEQNIALISKLLGNEGIAHRISNLVLEIKLY